MEEDSCWVRPKIHAAQHHFLHIDQPDASKDEWELPSWDGKGAIPGLFAMPAWEQLQQKDISDPLHFLS